MYNKPIHVIPSHWIPTTEHREARRTEPSRVTATTTSSAVANSTKLPLGLPVSACVRMCTSRTYARAATPD